MSRYTEFTEQVLAYWERVKDVKHPSVITHKGELTNEICNDNVYVEANIDEAGVLREISMFPRACCVCDAACMLAAEFFTGLRIDEWATFVTEEDWLKIVEHKFGLDLLEKRRSCVLLGFLALKSMSRCENG
jgi:hypothetical protein